MASDYQIGSMEIGEQKRTFDSFINWSIWGGLLVGLGVFGLVLIFGAHYQWLTATILMIGLGTILGFVLKMPISWYVTMGASLVLSIIISLLSGFIGLFV